MKNTNELRENELEVIPFNQKKQTQTERQANASLIPPERVEELRQRWTTVQSEFVDEPRKSVEEADKLVLATINQIQETFAGERSNLEQQWTRGDQISTEDLRLCLQRYRQFFDRLLSRM